MFDFDKKTKRKFAGNIADNHSIDARVQEFLRQKGGIRWHARSLSEDELRWYERITARILARIHQKLGAGIDFAATREEFRERANDYLAEAEQAVRDAELELEYRRKEVKLAARQF